MNISKYFQKSIKRLEVYVKRYSPEILAGVGIGGFITTTVLAVKATPKVMNKIKEETDKKGDDLTKMEICKVAYKDYIPAAITGVTSTICVIGSVSESARRNAALATAYKISETFANEYKEKVTETIGKRKEKKIRNEIAQDKVNENPPTEKTIILTGNGTTLFRDGLTGQYFRYDINKLKTKGIELGNTELNEGYTGVPEWLISLGLNVPDTMMGMGWSVADQGKAVTLETHATEAREYNGEPCLVIEYDPMPISDYNIFYK